MTWFHSQRDADLKAVRLAFFQKHGYGDVDDIANDIGDRWGDEARELFYYDLKNDPTVDQWNDGQKRRGAATAVSPFHVPAALYLDYLEGCVAAYAEARRYTWVESSFDVVDPFGPAVDYLNELFVTRRISYRFDEHGRAEWHGDEGAYVEVVRPALDALADTRLAGCCQEFEAALGHLRAGTPKDLEDAIEEAGKAVESAMKVVLDTHGFLRTGKEAAEKLWQTMRDESIVETPTHDAVVSTSRLRNEWGGHGQGGDVRRIPDGIPELAVRTSAAAIAYLASLLP